MPRAIRVRLRYKKEVENLNERPYFCVGCRSYIDDFEEAIPFHDYDKDLYYACCEKCKEEYLKLQ